MDEEGTEAAAVTIRTTLFGSTGAIAEVPTFRADHPFIILIKHSKSGTYFFMGRVARI